MPITYQRLGNSGGGMDLEITSYPNTEITLSNEKVTKRLISDGDGIAVFKGVKEGTYTAAANGKAKQITIMRQEAPDFSHGEVQQR